MSIVAARRIAMSLLLAFLAPYLLSQSPNGASQPASVTSTELPPEVKSAVEEAQRLERVKKPDDAIRLLKKTLKKNPESWTLAFELGRAYAAVEALKDSEDAYRKSLAAAQSEQEKLTSHFALGMCFFAEGR
ncbi:MAG TPA: tetratricopeptide repeat protein, partial [Candidatus Acidoferrales bacterium]|nr:tetratricopeptide repeat protein [Candidatus Acidoferrales bacterium]